MAENVSIKRNITANILVQIYTVLVSFVMAPVYLSYMGTEAYGLIGFFTTMQAWFQLLDLGLTPTIVRETALFRGGQISRGTLRVFLRSLEIIFIGVALVAGAAILLLNHQISTHWLQVRSLPISDVQIAIGIMGIIVPLRWGMGLYRGIVVGFERIAWLATYNTISTTVRFVGVLVVFAMGATSVRYFFSYQLVVSIVDLAAIWFMSRRLVQGGGADEQKEPFSWLPLIKNLSFSLTIAFASIAWVLLTQTDKLVLSRVLALSAFGVFSLAATAAGAINFVGGTISQALLPRMTKLAAEDRNEALYKLYSDATQTGCVIVLPAVAALTFLAEPILRAWTGHDEIAREAAPILRLYAIGNGAVALSQFAYYIQYARGNLRLHFVGTALSLLTLIPAFIWGGLHYGGLGTGVAWAAANCLYLVLWVPVVHARYLKGRHWKWVLRDVLYVALPPILLCWTISLLNIWPTGRFALIVFLGCVGIALALSAAAGSAYVRGLVRSTIARYGITRPRNAA
jgi:O-antigen/teichoic acid export membrane protein